ncbi:MAG: toll/interleukin-1 receptor domain-containing protein [Gammaproteobacteria bacterium]
MKQIDRFNLIDTIGRELQAQMTYSDIDIYLKGFGIDVSKPTSGANSKWVYSKELLADEPDDIIIRIANELEVEHSYSLVSDVAIAGSGYWSPNHFRLFLSHLATFKKQTHLLKQALSEFGISGFVAHESIDPTQEWQEEIEKALFSMDALAAIFMPGVNESKWIDQELGVAIGRDVLIIPVLKGLDPYGFIGKIQGLQTKNKSVAQVADDIYTTLVSNPKSKTKMIRNLVNLLVTERNIERAKQWQALLGNIGKIGSEHLQIIQTQVPENTIIMDNDALLKKINAMLEKHGHHKIQVSPFDNFDDDIPF